MGATLQFIWLAVRAVFCLFRFRAPAAGTPFSRDLKLSENFWLSEFISPNDPEGWAYCRANWHWLEQELRFVCREILEPARAHFGGLPVVITSALRSWIHNKRIGGATLSQHPKGRAVDFNIPGVPFAALHAYLGTLPKVGGLAWGPGFIHADSRPRLFGQIVRWTY